MVYNLLKISEIVKGKAFLQNNSPVEFLLYDSRRSVPSFNSLFFALKGKRDGHSFIPEMIDKGVKNFVVEKIPRGLLNKANFIVVDNTLKALQQLAKYHRQRFNLPVIAITGSNGKTIVKEWLAYFLEKDFNLVKSPKSFNSQVGVPLSVWEIQPFHDIGIFEAGISRPGEMKNLEEILKPRFGIFTNIGDAHQENFHSLEQKLTEKLTLFKNAEKIFFNANNPLIVKTIKEMFPGKKLFSWCFEQNRKNDCDLVAKVSFERKTRIIADFNGEKIEIFLRQNDLASVENALTVLLFLLDFLGTEKVKKLQFDNLPELEMRLQQIRGINNTVVINDSYNCDFTSLRIAIDYLCQLSKNKNKTLILSDLQQIGDEEKIYKDIANLLKNSNITRFIGIGHKISEFADFFPVGEKYFFTSTEEFLKAIRTFNFSNEIILLKGSRKFRFERISQVLEQKSHRTVFEINMNALKYNLSYFRNLLPPQTKIMVMVKAFSYGSGSFEIAGFLQNEGVDYLGVAIADEGLELREAGISTPIIVMNPDINTFNILISYDLEPEIYNFRLLDAFYEFARKNLHYPFPIHIKINTGMNRLGFDLSEIPELTKKLRKYSQVLRVRSVFSHLVASDDPNFDNFTLKQISDFEKVVKIFKAQFGNDIIAHILNSAGIERFPQHAFDMVRLGIGLYGVSAKNKKLEPIGTLKTKILQIRKVKAGESIGYSRAEFVKRDSIIATIPIGYADGLNRALSKGKGKVLVKNKLAPIVGNICMDMTMIDVTDIQGVKEGDEVIIFGKKLPLQTVAKWLGTIPYEVLTSVSSRVKRVYLWE